jgi:signal transduction histidine kinase
LYAFHPILVKDIVTLHSGHVSVSSQPDKETEFKIVLPKDLRAKRGIRGYKKDSSGKEPRELDANMQIAETINRKLQVLVESYKADSGKIKFKREFINAAPLVEDILAADENMLAQKRLALKKFIPQDTGSLWADKEKVKEVIRCMLNSAVKYAFADGSIMVKISGVTKEIRFEISNTGPGIPKESIEKLFEKQQDMAIETLERASFSLSMAKAIVESHKGKIWIESEAGKGSTFILVLPRDLRDRNII